MQRSVKVSSKVSWKWTTNSSSSNSSSSSEGMLSTSLSDLVKNFQTRTVSHSTWDKHCLLLLTMCNRSRRRIPRCCHRDNLYAFRMGVRLNIPMGLFERAKKTNGYSPIDHWNQYDQTARLYISIWPFSTMQICLKAYKCCQSKFKVLPIPI